MIEKSWKYIFPGEDGNPNKGTFMALDIDEARKRLVAMALPGATLECDINRGPESDSSQIVTIPVNQPMETIIRERPPVLKADPVRVVDQISKTAQEFNRDRDRAANLCSECDHKEKSPIVINKVKTRQRILFGEPHRMIAVADDLLQKKNGEVLHFSTSVDPKGNFLVSIVIRHEIEDENDKKI